MCNSNSCIGKVATDRQYQGQMFDQVYDILIDSLDIQVGANFLSTIILQLNVMIQTHHHSHHILQIFTFSNQIMLYLILSDANDPKGLMHC